jgi:cell pole-organizing protein PopZ
MPDNAKSSPEPSMEEIIASISRIITEDKKSSEPVGPVNEDKSDILELTEAVNEDGSVRRVTPSADNPRAISAGSGAAVDPAAADAATPINSEATPTDIGAQMKSGPAHERILSSATSEATAAAFAQLGALPRERRKEGELPLGGADRTLEDVVRDILRPLLQTWLDEHLPGIVERLVREEIARVVGEAGLR